MAMNFVREDVMSTTSALPRETASSDFMARRSAAISRSTRASGGWRLLGAVPEIPWMGPKPAPPAP